MSDRPERQTILGLAFGIAYAGLALGLFVEAGRFNRKCMEFYNAAIRITYSGKPMTPAEQADVNRLFETSRRFEQKFRLSLLLGILPASLSLLVTFPIVKRAWWRIVIGVSSPRDLLLRGPIAPGFEYSREAIRATRRLATTGKSSGLGPTHVPEGGEA